MKIKNFTISMYFLALISSIVPWLKFDEKWRSIYQFFFVTIKGPEKSSGELWKLMYGNEMAVFVKIWVVAVALLLVLFQVLCVVHIIFLIKNKETKLHLVIMYNGMLLFVVNLLFAYGCENPFVSVLFPMLFMLLPFMEFFTKRWMEYKKEGY